MSKRLHQTVLALSLGMLAMGTAHAQLVIEDGQSHSTSPPPTVTVIQSPSSPRSGLLIVDGYDSPAPVRVVPVVVARATPAVSASGVIELGHRPVNISSPKGWADGVPVSVALHQVVPSDFAIHDERVAAGQTVSWSGGRPWNNVLETVARNGHLNITIRWDEKTVTVVPGSQAALVSVNPTQTTTQTTTTVMVTHQSPMSHPVYIQPAPVVAPIQTWALDPSKSLRENVEAWVKKAGWNKLVWDGADYRVVAPATFTGQFDAPDGPLSRLIDGYADSDQPLLVKLTTMDRVVHVSNKGYQPVQVESVSAATLAPEVLTQSGADSAAATPEAVRSGSQLAPITINDHGVSRHH